MKLIDSNLIIYSAYPEYKYLRTLLMDETSHVSEVSRVEVLGYHQLTLDEKRFFESIFQTVQIVFPDQSIYDRAILLRQNQRVKLGDSLIAATALELGFALYTRDEADFRGIPGLTVVNPVG